MLLLLLPREIRDQIWIHSLKSRTGFVTLPDARGESDWGWRTPMSPLKIETYDPYPSIRNELLPPNDRIRLSLLRTCKQIQDECKGLLWRHNALVLHRSDDLSCLFWYGWATLKRQLVENLVHVQLDFNPFHTWKRNFGYLKSFLEIFATWATEGSLRRVDLKVVKSLVRRFLDSNGYVFRSGMDTMKLFEEFGGGGLAGVERRLVVNQPNFDLWDTRLVEARINVEELLDPQGVLVRLHDALRGELWIDGNLYYQNGRRVRLGSDPKLKPLRV